MLGEILPEIRKKKGKSWERLSSQKPARESPEVGSNNSQSRMVRRTNMTASVLASTKTLSNKVLAVENN